MSDHPFITPDASKLRVQYLEQGTFRDFDDFNVMWNPGYEIQNRATAYLDDENETTTDWDGVCGELADAIITPHDHILHVESPDNAVLCKQRWWAYHMVPLIDGLVHDAWCEGPARTIADWLVRMFPDTAVTLSVDGNDIWTGISNNFNEQDIDAMRHLCVPA